MPAASSADTVGWVAGVGGGRRMDSGPAVRAHVGVCCVVRAGPVWPGRPTRDAAVDGGWSTGPARRVLLEDLHLEGVDPLLGCRVERTPRLSRMGWPADRHAEDHVGYPLPHRPVREVGVDRVA